MSQRLQVLEWIGIDFEIMLSTWLFPELCRATDSILAAIGSRGCNKKYTQMNICYRPAACLGQSGFVRDQKHFTVWRKWQRISIR